LTAAFDGTTVPDILRPEIEEKYALDFCSVVWEIAVNGKDARPFPLTLGLARTPYTQALFDGTVEPRGILLNCQEKFSQGLDNTGARHREIIAGMVPGGELSTSSFILAQMRGIPLLALPVFPARGFRHRTIYCHRNSPIREPQELRGSRVTAHRYNATTAVWVRGLLQNEYGVKPESMEWHVAEPDVGEEARCPPPPEVKVQFIAMPRTREHALELVEEGLIDAAFEPYGGLEERPKLRRLFPSHREVEGEYFRRTRIFPIIHTLVLREEFAAERAWILESLVEAFRRSLAHAERYVSEREKEELRWQRELMGSDWPRHELDDCARETLAALIQYQRQQGLIEQEPQVEKLFFPESLKL
jgi:4,5-dihydroxyphthalate decarboxylase